MTCAACDRGRANARAAGHRDWRKGVCFTHAAFDLDSAEGRALMAGSTEDGVRKAARQMGIPCVAPGALVVQPDFFLGSA